MVTPSLQWEMSGLYENDADGDLNQLGTGLNS